VREHPLGLDVVAVVLADLRGRNLRKQRGTRGVDRLGERGVGLLRAGSSNHAAIVAHRRRGCPADPACAGASP
jgi:hypothetical protein